MELSEIRDSTKVELLEKVRQQDYGKYLLIAREGLHNLRRSAS